MYTRLRRLIYYIPLPKTSQVHIIPRLDFSEKISLNVLNNVKRYFHDISFSSFNYKTGLDTKMSF